MHTEKYNMTVSYYQLAPIMQRFNSNLTREQVYLAVTLIKKKMGEDGGEIDADMLFNPNNHFDFYDWEEFIEFTVNPESAQLCEKYLNYNDDEKAQLIAKYGAASFYPHNPGNYPYIVTWRE